MELFPYGVVYDFMGARRLFAAFSLITIIGSIVLLFYPGPRLGTDFRGGTEVEVAFKGAITAGEIRQAANNSGFDAPDVIKIDDPKNPQRYLIRVGEVTTIDESKQQRIERSLCAHEAAKPPECPPERQANEVKFSPGGEKITIRFREAPDLEWVKQRISAIPGVVLREGTNNPTLQSARDNKVEVLLKSKGDQLMDGLRSSLGVARVPDSPLRVEWIGPKAGAQLRDAALQSVAISLVFIMAYVAFRFDVRFAPGAIVALFHDAVVTVGWLIVFGREVNLTTVAAVLTIIGYSVNDTVVVYDRVRENLGRLRGASFSRLINVSLSEMMSRTILASATVMFSLVAFLIWGTGTLKEFAFTLLIGMVLGMYSSIYVALPLTEWLDRKLFSRKPRAKNPAPVRKKTAEAV
ncbi:MAG TPA: protein translocase subunit SecF [Polyangiaceae bacterium]|nr:protein translocase subunit SecF [Polyangiaceae bacterium]